MEIQGEKPQAGWTFHVTKGERWCDGQLNNFYVSGYNAITGQVAPMCSVKARSEEQAIRQFQLQLPQVDK
ncbi:MAG TPA: hypothetical protein VFO76_09890 [Candidatus Kapabacteria bacterium]|nr:hypothetical protein [Candidatus Kapabacteria bacterium]